MKKKTIQYLFRTKVFWVLVFCLGFSLTASAVTQNRTVSVTGGNIEGEYSNSMAVFKGIPYAAPPVGEFRFKGPQDVISWSGTKKTTRYSPACYTSVAFAKLIAPLESASEDCLYLNVWTPKYRRWGEKQPVMVWIHGGGLEGGSGRGLIYNPKYLLKKGDLIVVTINYRLGEFGFAWHDALNNTEDGALKGNYGFRDQIKALQWVKDNIAQFGGDPDNITIFGESAGGWSVVNQLASPLAAGLFNKVIVESGGTVAIPIEEAGERTESILQHLNCDQGSDENKRECYQNKSVEEIQGAIEVVQDAPIGFNMHVAVIDGIFLPDHPLKIIEAGNHNHVPVITGSNDDEIPSFLISAYTEEKYHETMDSIYTVPAENAAVKSWYNESNFGTHNAALSNMITDVVFRCQMKRLNTALFNNQTEPVYLYEFHFPSSLLPAFHFSEVLYLFQNPTILLPESYALHNNMLERWTEFAIDGDPNPWEWWKPEWEAYDPFNQGLMRLDTPLKMEYTSDDPGCQVLDSMDYTRYPGDVNSFFNSENQLLGPILELLAPLIEILVGIEIL